MVRKVEQLLSDNLFRMMEPDRQEGYGGVSRKLYFTTKGDLDDSTGGIGEVGTTRRFNRALVW